MNTWVPYCYKAIAQRVIDGDSVVMTVDLGCYVYIIRTCRLLGINTPELHDPDEAIRAQAQRAKSTLTAELGNQTVYVKTERDQGDKYGRLLVTIYEREDAEKSLNKLMVEWGLAVPSVGWERV